MWRYEVLVDIHEDEPTWGDKERYVELIDKYGALAIGHDAGKLAGTSTLLFTSARKIKKGKLEKELGDIKILGFRRRILRVAA